jgi:hypothetical protein
MIGGLIIILLTSFIAFVIIGNLKRKYPFIDQSILQKLFFYHLFLLLVYYLYVQFNPSDSKGYYQSAFEHETWFELYGTSTTFIKFLNYPFVKYLGVSYEGMMAMFAFCGYLGFVYFYIVFKESIRFQHKFFSVNLLTLILFLPNLHFWSTSIGKGAIIFLGIAMFFYGIHNIRHRWVSILIGGILVYHVRPHIMLVILLSSVLGFVFSTKGIKLGFKIVFVIGAAAAFFFIYRDVLALVGIDEEQFLSQGLDLSRRAHELSKTTSGVDIASYSLPVQVFTFLYRPLFFDAPGMLGLIVSFENLFYIFITLKLFSLRGVKFLLTGNVFVKTAFFSFITVSVALAQVSGNLGLAIRQKSQVMMLLLFVVLMFLDEQKTIQWRWIQFRRYRIMRKQVQAQPVNGE